ncbi:DUF1758 domain-containing protein [Trichonephila clavipes]|nr:DUF1758 domain-containing protein [Trichonephila clavipes]
MQSILTCAVIRLHVEKYINKYKDACEMLNELHVDDLINSTSDATEALQLSEEMIHILGEAGMNFTRWATNSTTLHEAWKLANIDCREISQESGVPLKTLGKFWDKANHYLKFDIKQFEKLNNLVKETKSHFVCSWAERKCPPQRDEGSNEMLDRSNEMLDRSNEMLDRSNEILDRSNEMLDRSNEILDRSNEILDRSNEILDRSNEILDRSNEMLDRSNEILDMSNEIFGERAPLIQI